MSQDRLSPDIPRYLRMDVLGGALVCIVAIGVWFESTGLAVGELSYFGPGFLPRVLAVILLIAGLGLLVVGLVQSNSVAERLVLAVRGPCAIGLAILVFALTIHGFSLGPIQIPQLGILLAGPLTVVIAGMGGSDAKLRELIVLGVGLTAVSVLVFADALSMQLPVFPAFVEHSLPNAWGPDWPRRAAVLLYAVIGYGLWRAFGLTLANLRDLPDREETP